MNSIRQHCVGTGGSVGITQRALITGGSGYLGFRLATELSKQGIEVVLLDIYRPVKPLPSGVHFVHGSVADSTAVDLAFSTLPSGPLDAVFHVASYGMSGRELRDRAQVVSVNVGGTRNVISACLRYGVPRLVYVSTCNVIFVGKPISGADETAPYPPPTAYKDPYSSTKAQAERLVLEANGLKLLHQQDHHAGKSLSSMSGSETPVGPSARRGDGDGDGDGDTDLQVYRLSGPGGQLSHPSPDRNRADANADAQRIYTCCIRSTGIWGPGETRHQPRVIRMVRAGLFRATFGDPSSTSDWIHVDNLVQILILAERGLRLPDFNGRTSHLTGGADGSLGEGGGHGTCELKPIAGGQVYYASDGSPINNFHHFKPFIVGLGYPYPSLNVPFWLVYGIAWLIEYAWPLLSPFVRDPPLTRMEVDKCCIEHWFDISKARRELGYKPAVYDREEVVRNMAAEGWAATDVPVAGGTAAGDRHRALGMNAVRLSAVVAAIGVAVVLVAVAFSSSSSSSSTRWR